MSLLSFLQDEDKDAKLMQAYATGDAEAFESLYSQYKGPLFRFFLRQCHSRAIAEELYQELWLKVIKARESYQPKAKFKTWIYHIAHNIVIDYFRKNSQKAELFEELETVELAARSTTNPDTLVTREEVLQRYRERLKSLPQQQREVFILKEEGGHSLEAIAQITGESFETVKSRLRYAVQKLRQVLQCHE